MGFWVTTNNGHKVHISGDPKMSESTLNALRDLFDKAIDQATKEMSNIGYSNDDLPGIHLWSIEAHARQSEDVKPYPAPDCLVCPDCRSCDGYGYLNNDADQPCPDCDGKGFIKETK